MGVKGSDIRIARNDGIVAWGTIVSFAESPKRAGVLYTGTDEGNLHVSRDGGKDWASVSDRVPDLPRETFVSEVVPSRFDEATVYATLRSIAGGAGSGSRPTFPPSASTRSRFIREITR
jgi:hypothetical protein